MQISKLTGTGFFLAIMIASIAVFVYAPATQGTFVWDDDAHLTHNHNLKDFAGLKRIWTSEEAYYYPLTSATFWIGRHLWGLDPFPYHILNLVLHLINALLFGLILKKLRIPGGLFAAAIFALHPVHVESVAWITELKNVQCCFFYLLSILSWIRFDSNRLPSRAPWYAASFLFFALSLLSKPASVMLPVVLFVISSYMRRRWSMATVVRMAPFLILALAVSGWTIWEQTVHSGAKGDEWSFTFLERLQIAGCAVWFYLGKLLWPHPLMFIYPRWQLDPGNLLCYAPAIGIFALSLIFYKRYKRVNGRNKLRPYGIHSFFLPIVGARFIAPVSFAAAYFVLFLFPVLGFFNIYFMRYSFVADHFQYLASLGPIALFSALLWNDHWKVPWRIGISLIILVLLSGLTWRHAHIFQNAESLWRDTIEKNPKAWMAHNNLGTVLLWQGKYEEAAKHYNEALWLKGNLLETHSNLGVALTEMGSYEEAIEHFRAALNLDPRSAVAHNGLGHVLARLGQIEEAIDHYRTAIELKPDFALPYSNLGHELMKRGEVAPARAYLHKAASLELE